MMAKELTLADIQQLTEDFADARNAMMAAGDAHLKSGGWVRVNDALPVVPEGLLNIRIWCFNEKTSQVWKVGFHLLEKKMHRQATHWQYNYTPKPPKQTK